MNRKIFIIMLAATTTLSLNGCSKADVEKHPVKIEDSNTNLDTNLSDKETIENEKQNTELTGKTLNENTATGNTDSTVKETSSETKAKNTTAISELEGKEVDLKVEIEGSTEIVKGKIHVSELGYQMVYDSENFELSTKLGVDSYMAKNPDPVVYPYVFLNVSRYENTTMKEYSKQLEKDINAKMSSPRNLEGKSYEELEKQVLFNSQEKIEYKEIGEQQDKTLYYRLKSGEKKNTMQEYYVIQDDADIILIETQSFLEAEEGYGARFSAMLDTFKLL